MITLLKSFYSLPQLKSYVNFRAFSNNCCFAGMKNLTFFFVILMPFFYLRAKSDEEDTYDYDSNDVFLPVSMWHDVNEMSYRDGLSYEDDVIGGDVTYPPIEGWLQNPYSSSRSDSLNSSETYSQQNSPDESPFWLQGIRALPPPPGAYDMTFIKEESLPRGNGGINHGVDFGLQPASHMGVDNSFAIDPEFSFLHGLCMPAGPGHFMSSPGSFVQNVKQHTATTSGSNDSSSDSCAGPTSEPTSTSSSNGDETSSSGSRESGQSVEKFSVLPDIGNDKAGAKPTKELKSKLIKFDAKLQERILSKLNELQIDPKEDWLKNLPKMDQQWDNDHSVLPSINQASKAPMRRNSNSDTSLRQRLGSELPTIWEDASPNQVICWCNTHSCMFGCRLDTSCKHGSASIMHVLLVVPGFSFQKLIVGIILRWD